MLHGGLGQRSLAGTPRQQHFRQFQPADTGYRLATLLVEVCASMILSALKDEQTRTGKCSLIRTLMDEAPQMSTMLAAALLDSSPGMVVRNISEFTKSPEAAAELIRMMKNMLGIHHGSKPESSIEPEIPVKNRVSGKDDILIV